MTTLVLIVLAAAAQTATDADRDDRLDLMRRSAERYVVTVDGDVVASLNDDPLLRWTNPLRQTPDGTVFLWTLEGRPVAALCVYPNDKALDHEWQSLTGRPLVARYPGAEDWTPTEPGLTFAPLPDAPPAADSPRLRLSQMRSLARRFTASVYKPPNSQQIRLLTQPVYRYPEKTPGAADGAIFAFVQGTDPEVLLLLEARKDAGGLRWYYALARMSSVFLECRDRDALVWTVEPDWTHDPNRPYVTFLKRVAADETVPSLDEE